jgi:hypothetical protein
VQQNGRVAGRELGAAGDCYFGSGVSALFLSSGADLVAVLLKWKLQGTKSVPWLVEEDQIRTRFLVFLFPAFSVTNKSGEIRERGTRKPAYWVVRTVRFDLSNCCCRRCRGEARYYLEISEQPGEIWIARMPEDTG